jgi:hypothetical protein
MRGYFKQTNRTKRWCSEARNVNDWYESFLKCFLGIVPSIYDVATVGCNVSKGEGVSPQRICGVIWTQRALSEAEW